MELSPTIRNDTENQATDWQPSQLSGSKGPNIEWSRDDSLVWAKIGSSSVDSSIFGKGRPRSEESSYPLRSLDSTNTDPLITQRSDLPRALPQRFGDVMSDKQFSSPSASSASIKSPNSGEGNHGYWD
jgi:hypothetical protein